MTKNTRPPAPASKPAPKKFIPSYMKETFGMVQKGKSNHVSPKNAKRGR